MDDRLHRGSIIPICHYSCVTPIKAQVVEDVHGCYLLRMSKDTSIKSMFEGDPVVYAYTSHEGEDIRGAMLQEFNKNENTIFIIPDRVSSLVHKEFRQYTRFPVSLYSEITVPGIKKKMFGFISNMSYYGILLHLKEDLEIGTPAVAHISFGNTVTTQKGIITRKANHLIYMSYGIRFEHSEPTSYNQLKILLKTMYEDLSHMLRRV